MSNNTPNPVPEEVEKQIDEIMEDCAFGHNFDYAGKALKSLFASLRQATIKEVVERVKAESPEDQKDDCCINSDCPRHAWREGLNKSNAQWRAALNKIEEEMR